MHPILFTKNSYQLLPTEALILLPAQMAHRNIRHLSPSLVECNLLSVMPKAKDKTWRPSEEEIKEHGLEEEEESDSSWDVCGYVDPMRIHNSRPKVKMKRKGSDDKIQPKGNNKTAGESVTEKLDTQPVKLHNIDSDYSDDEGPQEKVANIQDQSQK